MSSWFIYSLIALVAIGGMQALYKVPSSKGHNKFPYSFLGFVVATILSLIFFYPDIRFDQYAIGYALLWGTSYALLVLFQMEILKKLDTSTSFPITSLGSHLLVVILGVLFFHDALSSLQFIAIVITFILVGFYNYTNKHITLSNGLLPIAMGIIFLSTFSKFIQKYGSVSTDINNFIFWQLFFAAIATFLIILIFNKNQLTKTKVNKNLIIWSTVLGVLNFIGTVSIVKALSIGPFSLVYTINSFYILVSSIVAWKFFGEELTRKKLVFILLAIIVIILIKLG